MGELSPWHWAIIAVVVLVLFGSKKLPDAARSFGRSLRILKTELHGLHEEDRPTPAAAEPVIQATVPAERATTEHPEPTAPPVL